MLYRHPTISLSVIFGSFSVEFPVKLQEFRNYFLAGLFRRSSLSPDSCVFSSVNALINMRTRQLRDKKRNC